MLPKAFQWKVVSMCKSSRSRGAGPRKFTPSWSRGRSPYIGSPLNLSYAEFLRFMLQFLCLQMCVYGGSAVPQGGEGDRHLVTVPQGVTGDCLPWGGAGQGGGVPYDEQGTPAHIGLGQKRTRMGTSLCCSPQCHRTAWICIHARTPLRLHLHCLVVVHSPHSSTHALPRPLTPAPGQRMHAPFFKRRAKPPRSLRCVHPDGVHLLPLRVGPDGRPSKEATGALAQCGQYLDAEVPDRYMVMNCTPWVCGDVFRTGQTMFYTTATVESFHFLLHLCSTVHAWVSADPENVAVLLTLVDDTSWGCYSNCSAMLAACYVLYSGACPGITRGDQVSFSLFCGGLCSFFLVTGRLCCLIVLAVLCARATHTSFGSAQIAETASRACRATSK